MRDLESTLRTLIREEVRLAFEEMLPRLRSQQITKPQEPQVPLLLSTREAAKQLSVSERTLFALTKSGLLPCVRVGMAKRYSVETITKWIQVREAEPDRPSNSESRQPGPISRRSPRQQEQKRTESKNKQVKPKSRKVSTSRTSAESTAVPKQLKAKEQPANPLALLLDGIGVERDVVSAMTQGELMRIAGVDLPTYHGWRFLGRSMPEEAIERLREYFRKLPKKRNHESSKSKNSSAND